MSLAKIKLASELAEISRRMSADGLRLVFTNGCFDLLHVGHVRYLAEARKLGDALLVAVNGDASVRTLKGEGRPVNPEADRAEVLAALESVDYLTVFHEPRVTNVLRLVRPQVYAKGGDYTIDTLNAEEAAALREIGSELRILPLVPGRSTTSIIEKWRS